MRKCFLSILILTLIFGMFFSVYAESSRRSGLNENISTYGTGKDYTALATWESDTDTNMIGYKSEVLECYDNGSPYDDYVYLSGGFTDPNFHRIIRAESGSIHDGTVSSGVVFASTSDADGFKSAENYFFMQDLIISVNCNSASNRTPISFRTGGDECMSIGNIVYNSNNAGAGVCRGILMNTGTGTFTYCINTLVYDVEDTGVEVLSGTLYCYNTTSVYNDYGFDGSGGVAKNCCASGNTTNDWSGSWTKTTCTSEGANPVYENEGGDDFHLASGDSVCKDQGTDLSSDPNFPFDDDADYETRSGSWDIGFDEYIATGTVGGTDQRILIIL